MANVFGASSTADQVLAGRDLAGKHFLIAGASSGIGLETARSLASHGASIVGPDIDMTRAETSTAPFRVAASDEGAGLKQLVRLDLGSLQSVEAAARPLLSFGRQFDRVILNAGIFGIPFSRTVDGFERQLGTNYLGHFALAQQIEQLLAPNGLLLAMSSQAHRSADVDLQDPNFDRQPYDAWLAYSRSKTANALFAFGFRSTSSRPRHPGRLDAARDQFYRSSPQFAA